MHISLSSWALLVFLSTLAAPTSAEEHSGPKRRKTAFVAAQLKADGFAFESAAWQNSTGQNVARFNESLNHFNTTPRSQDESLDIGNFSEEIGTKEVVRQSGSPMEFVGTACMLGIFILLSCLCVYVELAGTLRPHTHVGHHASRGPVDAAGIGGKPWQGAEAKQWQAPAAHQMFSNAGGRAMQQPTHMATLRGPLSPYPAMASPAPSAQECIPSSLAPVVAERSLASARRVSFADPRPSDVPFSAASTARDLAPSPLSSRVGLSDQPAITAPMPAVCHDFVLPNESGFRMCLPDLEKRAPTLPVYSVGGHALLFASLQPGMICVSMKPNGALLGGVANAGRTFIVLDSKRGEFGKLQPLGDGTHFKLVRHGEILLTMTINDDEICMRSTHCDEVLAVARTMNDQSWFGGQAVVDIGVAVGMDPVLSVVCVVAAIVELGALNRQLR